MNGKEVFLKFITGQGTILVRDGSEFARFLAMLRHHDVMEILGRKPQTRQYSYWLEIASINNGNPNLMVFEYQPGKGLSIYYDVTTPTNWYGEEPMVLDAA